jgi:hypothetical protein
MSESQTFLERHWRLVGVAAWAVVGLSAVAVVILYPPIAERLLSSDGELAAGSRRALFVLDAALVAMAVSLAVVNRRLRQYTPGRERVVVGTVFGVVSIVGSLFVCEVGLRAASGFRPIPADRHFFFLHDEMLGWRHRPGAVALFKNAVVRINSAGLRDDELASPAGESESRLMFLGDSQVFGDGVSFDDTFVQRLEREFRSLQSINGGVIGYGTDQQLLYFERDGEHLAPDLTIVGLNAYDLRDNISTRVRSGYIKPLFELVEGQLRLVNVPISKGSLVDRAQRELRTRSHLYTLATQKWGGDGDADGDSPGGGHKDLAREVFPPDAHMGKALDVTAAILSRLAARVKSRNARFAVVFLPYDMDFVGDGWYTERVDRMVHTLSQAGQRDGFAVFDLRPYLQDCHDLFIDRMHFNVEGHRLVASALKSLLVQNGLLQESHVN